MQIIWTGTTKPPSLALLNDVYLKRLNPFVKIQITELRGKRANLTGTASAREEELIFRKNLQRERSHVVLLSEEGGLRSSREFAAWLERNLGLYGKRLTFVIWDANGFSPEFKAEADEIISLSPMTLSHQIARLVLLEQLYRAFTILHNHPYHND